MLAWLLALPVAGCQSARGFQPQGTSHAPATAGAAPVPGPRAGAPDVDRPDSARADGYEDCNPHNGFPALIVFVRDSVTGRGVADRALLEWRAGRSSGVERYYPKFPATEALAIAGPYGRPGVYDFTVRARGYRPWHAAGILVAQGATRCSVPDGAAATVQVRLQPDTP